jgi:hypothetical protein
LELKLLTLELEYLGIENTFELEALPLGDGLVIIIEFIF